MPRPTSRCRLQSGFKLDINRLVRQGAIKPGAYRSCSLKWTNSYTEEETAKGTITAEMKGPDDGWFRIQIKGLSQHIRLVARPRHYGGRQWYFICPYMNRRVSVLWMPSGAREFACRQRWGRAVAYNSQCSDRVNRAHQGQARIKSTLCSIGGFDPDEWEFPPKPKWMRWKTYKRAEEQFDRYEEVVNGGLMAALIKLSR